MDRYFGTLLEGLPDGYYAYIWGKRQKTNPVCGEAMLDSEGAPQVECLTYWVSTPSDAIQACQKLMADGRWDIYLGRGVSKGQRGPNARVGNENADGIIDFCLDLDYGTDGHRNEGYPETEARALELLCEVRSKGLQPTVVLHSGHGVQVRIRMKEAWLLQSPEDRKRALEMSRSLQRLFSDVWSAAGYSLDPTMDLGRVLRVPGTTNYKSPDHPVEVRWLDDSSDLSAAYTLDELDGLLPALERYDRQVVKVHQATNIGGLTLSPGATPDAGKLERLTKSDMVVRSIIEDGANARDSKGQPFGSTSERDLSIATRAARHGWDAQEVVDLIIYSRAKNGDALKLNQRGRYLSTVEKAMAAAVKSYDCRAADALQKHESGGALSDEERECLVDEISRLLNLSAEQQVREVTRYRLEGRTIYVLSLANGHDVDFSGISSLMSAKSLLNAFADTAGLFLSIDRKTDLSELPRLVLAACVEDDLDIAHTPEDIARDDLRQYIREHSIYLDAVTAYDMHSIHYDGDGYLWFSANEMCRSLGKEAKTVVGLGRMLTKLGVSRHSKRLRDGRNVKLRRVKATEIFDDHERNRLLSQCLDAPDQ